MIDAALAELQQTNGNWSTVYMAMDELLESDDLDAKQLAGLTGLRFDDDRTVDWFEFHSLRLT